MTFTSDWAGEVTYVFGVKAVDQNGRDEAGELSNLASVSMADLNAAPDPESGIGTGAAIAIGLGKNMVVFDEDICIHTFWCKFWTLPQ